MASVCAWDCNLSKEQARSLVKVHASRSQRYEKKFNPCEVKGADAASYFSYIQLLKQSISYSWPCAADKSVKH